MTCTYMHPQRANIPLQGLERRKLTVGATSGSHSKIGASFGTSFGTILPVVDLHGQQKALRKSRTVTLASGGSEHAQLFSVAISWGNKMNFSLCANILGFCSDSHIWYLKIQYLTVAEPTHYIR